MGMGRRIEGRGDVETGRWIGFTGVDKTERSGKSRRNQCVNVLGSIVLPSGGSYFLLHSNNSKDRFEGIRITNGTPPKYNNAAEYHRGATSGRGDGDGVDSGVGVVGCRGGYGGEWRRVRRRGGGGGRPPVGMRGRERYLESVCLFRDGNEVSGKTEKLSGMSFHIELL
ncbi:hypothetical protein Tco_0591887 [Tanacetum coccineum]